MLDVQDTPRTCAHCGYITDHLASDRCPECGTPAETPSPPRSLRMLAGLTWLTAATWILAYWNPFNLLLGCADELLHVTWLISILLFLSWVFIDGFRWNRGFTRLEGSAILVALAIALAHILLPG
ncbi:MAG TPA: hypothetical protein P5572_07085 [Phycisphaerae bacterium]|nr:hypothetical protein [Phycisphaerales bacterium]HRX84765.1 hypothetical protein [Phycisphaerae bacterium]